MTLSEKEDVLNALANGLMRAQGVDLKASRTIYQAVEATCKELVANNTDNGG